MSSFARKLTSDWYKKESHYMTYLNNEFFKISLNLIDYPNYTCNSLHVYTCMCTSLHLTIIDCYVLSWYIDIFFKSYAFFQKHYFIISLNTFGPPTPLGNQNSKEQVEACSSLYSSLGRIKYDVNAFWKTSSGIWSAPVMKERSSLSVAWVSPFTNDCSLVCARTCQNNLI